MTQQNHLKANLEALKDYGKCMVLLMKVSRGRIEPNRQAIRGMNETKKERRMVGRHPL